MPTLHKKAIARLNACSKTSKKIVLESWQFSTSQEFEEECQKAERLIQKITESIENYREYTTTSSETFVEEGIVATFIFQVKRSRSYYQFAIRSNYMNEKEKDRSLVKNRSIATDNFSRSQ